MSSPIESIPESEQASNSQGGSQSWIAVFLMTAAMLCFTSLDAIMKSLYAEHSLGMLVMLRNLIQVAVLISLVPVIGGTAVRTKRYGFHFLRGACMMLTTVFITLALSSLPMAQTYSITFSTPLMATLIAALALGERPGLAQWDLYRLWLCRRCHRAKSAGCGV
jgi:drug/metabolite transporter (DMT)-like permease